MTVYNLVTFGHIDKWFKYVILIYIKYVNVYFVIGLSRGRWDTSPRVDPFLPCNSHHFESNLRPMVLARRNTQGTDRSTSSASNINTTTDNSTPTSPNEPRPYTGRRRPRTRYVPDAEAFLSGIHPILTWGRNHRNNTATTSASNNVQGAGQAGVLLADTLAGQISN